MKNYSQKIFVFVIAIVTCFLAVFSQSSKEVKILFYRGQHLEEVKGELGEAIKVYQDVLERFPEERTFAARALLRIGICYKKMGDQQAQQAFQRIIQEFADQPEIAAEAQTRLRVLQKPERLIASEGMISRQVWADHQTDPSGSISPDGRYLSYVNWYTGDLHVRDILTGINRKLTNNPSGSLDFAMDARWSPDGKKIAYYWNVRPFADLRIVGMDGSEPRVLLHYDWANAIIVGGWSPDGKFISVCIKERDTKTQKIALIAVEDGEVRELKSEELTPIEMGPFSLDGRYIMYDRPQMEGSYERDIFLLATDGRGEIPLIEHRANDRFLGLSPDGNWLLFYSDRSGINDAWIIQVENGKTKGAPRMIKSGIGEIEPLGITRNGEFYYHFQSRDRDPYTVDFDPEALTILSKPKRVNHRFIGSGRFPDWSPDGKWLAYLSIRTNIPLQGPTQVLVIRSEETGEERELSLDESLDFSAGLLQWFPDNRSLVVYAKDKKGNRGVFRIDSQTADVKPLFLFKEDHIFRAPSISPDGKTIYYIFKTEKGTLSRIIKKDVETGEETILLKALRPETFAGAALSPDGRKIAYQFFDREKYPDFDILHVLPTTGGEPVEVLRERAVKGRNISSRLAWTPDGSHILFCRGNGDKDLTQDLWIVPAAGGAPKKLGLELTGVQYIQFHPDGKQIGFMTGRFIDEIWMLENFLPKK